MGREVQDLSKIYIGKRIQQVPHWQYPERHAMPHRFRDAEIYQPQMATVVAINPRRRTYTVRYDKSGLLETMKAVSG